MLADTFQAIKVGRDLALVPGLQNAVHISEIFVEGSASYSRFLRYAGHGQSVQSGVGCKFGGLVHDRGRNGVFVRLDRLIPKFWHGP